MSKTKKKFRWFFADDFDKEEAFLRRQHKNGWKFVRFCYPGFYIFEKCKPEDVVYRLDYSNVRKEEKESYLQIFRDCEWEYLFDVNGWSYFRKAAEDVEENNEIFSDMETKIEFLSRVKRSMIPLLVIFFCIIIPQLIVQYHNMNSVETYNSMKMAGTVFFVIYVIFFALYLVLFVKFGLGIRRLKRKYLTGREV